jgi:hypothetical protein
MKIVLYAASSIEKFRILHRFIIRKCVIEIANILEDTHAFTVIFRSIDATNAFMRGIWLVLSLFVDEYVRIIF